MNTIQIKIGGMHCAACANTVRQAALSFSQIDEATVDLQKEILSLVVTNGTDYKPDIENQLKKKLEELGYQWNATGNKKDTIIPLVRYGAPALSLIIFAAYLILDKHGILARYFSLILPKTDGGAPLTTASFLAVGGSSFVMGLIASGSSCLAVVGSLVISFSSLYNSKNILKPNLFFHVARISTFIIMGALLGILGKSFTSLFEGQSSHFATALFQIIVGIILLTSAAMILGNKTISNLVSRLLPKKVDHFFSTITRSDSVFAPFILGALTFILPCGFTQTVQAQALASGNSIIGAVVLGSFALGTFPVLFAAGVSVSWTKKRGNGFFTRFAGFLVALLALWTIISALLIIPNTNKNLVTQESSQTRIENTPAVKETHTIEMRVLYQGFTPRIIEIPAGENITWIIWGDEVTGCTNAIVVPALNLKFKVQPGKNVISFRSPSTPGIINYSCWMGMVRGQLRVVQ